MLATSPWPTDAFSLRPGPGASPGRSCLRKRVPFRRQGPGANPGHTRDPSHRPQARRWHLPWCPCWRSPPACAVTHVRWLLTLSGGGTRKSELLGRPAAPRVRAGVLASLLVAPSTTPTASQGHDEPSRQRAQTPEASQQPAPPGPHNPGFGVRFF